MDDVISTHGSNLLTEVRGSPAGRGLSQDLSSVCFQPVLLTHHTAPHVNDWAAANSVARFPCLEHAGGRIACRVPPGFQMIRSRNSPAFIFPFPFTNAFPKCFLRHTQNTSGVPDPEAQPAWQIPTHAGW